ncbi:lysophospholipid acyltransferase family protein [Aquisphaera insulae]|uniref:lysophospholipid acyltransferase family protein n=1 Tax=Aquisphaera insulae TaxID=2712864 RepID=UPI0013EDC7C2|nr:lysophospholipid acyltransferase family protein [Aquisphaera insulae]
MSDSASSTSPPSGSAAPVDPPPVANDRRPADAKPDRSAGAVLWYRVAQYTVSGLLRLTCGWRSTGTENMPKEGGVLLVCNHMSFLDVMMMAVPLRRPLNWMARSTLFKGIIGFCIRTLGGFPIQREGMGVSGLKETLKRLRNGGIVGLFPEGTRSPDGKLGEFKPGIAAIVQRAGVPVVPGGIAGTFQAWPRSRKYPRRHPLAIHYGRPIRPEEFRGLDTQATSDLIRARLAEAIADAEVELWRGRRRPAGS